MGFIQVRGPSLCLSPHLPGGLSLCLSPHFPGAHLCASGPPLSQGSPLLRLPRYTASLLSPRCPTLSRSPTSSGPSVSISTSGCWVLTSCPAHLLPPATFLGGPSFHCGEGRGPQRDCLSSKSPGEEWGHQAAVVVNVWHQPHEGSPHALTYLHSCKAAACGMLVPGTGEGRWWLLSPAHWPRGPARGPCPAGAQPHLSYVLSSVANPQL